MRGSRVAQSKARQQTDVRRRASDMWMGASTMCGETSMVLGITVGERTSVFLAAPAVIERLADQIATMLAVPGAGVPDGSAPCRLPGNEAPREGERAGVRAVKAARGAAAGTASAKRW